MPRSYADPAGLWSMPVDVPYAKGVRHGDLIATCGQCPFDLRGDVLALGDPERQAELIMDHVARVLTELGAGLGDLVRLVVFHAANDEGALLRRIRRCLPEGAAPSVVPVPLPCFYYPGMMTEIDAVAQLGPRRGAGRPNAPFPTGVRVGEIVHLSGHAAPEAGEPLAQLNATLDAVERTLGELGAGLDDVIKLTTCYQQELPWAALAARRARRFRQRWPVITDIPLPRLGRVGAALSIEAVAVTGGTRREIGVPPGAGSWPIPLPHPRALRCGPLLFVGAQTALTPVGVVQAPGEMAAQTHACMTGLGDLLAAEGLGFADVFKVNTYYVGAARGEDLHANLAIRSAHFRRPGPASTGVPVERLPFDGAMIQIEMLAIGGDAG